MKPFRQKQGLKITGNQIQFSATPGVDPEGQQAVNRFSARVPAAPNLAGAQSGNAQFGTLPGVIEYSTGAGQMANGARSACAGCKHHDVRAWNKFLSDATNPGSTPEMRATIHTLRARIMMSGAGFMDANDELDVDATLKAFGICRPMNDLVEGSAGRDPVFWPVATWREACCPGTVKMGPGKPEFQVVTAERPLGFFTPKSLDDQKIGAQRYDAVLRAAQGTKR